MSRAKNIIGIGKNTIRMEAASVAALEGLLDDQFEKAVEMIFACKGRVIVSGIGKSGIIAQKVVATLNSTGTPAIFLHAADAIHGDWGWSRNRMWSCCSAKAGKARRSSCCCPLSKGFRNPLIGMVGNLQSTWPDSVMSC
jgi:arabinose-5-phosphate isomerase